MHKKFILLIVYCLLGCHSLLGQPKPYILKSPKPVSFESVLSGLSSYNFLIEEKESYNFIEAYFFEELKKWISAVRPGIKFGIDYTKPSPEHLYIVPFFFISYTTNVGWNLSMDGK